MIIKYYTVSKRGDVLKSSIDFHTREVIEPERVIWTVGEYILPNNGKRLAQLNVDTLRVLCEYSTGVAKAMIESHLASVDWYL